MWISEQTAIISAYIIQEHDNDDDEVIFCLHVRSVVDEVSLEQSFLQILLLSTVSIIPPIPHTRICLHAALREGLAKSGNTETTTISRQSDNSRQ